MKKLLALALMMTALGVLAPGGAQAEDTPAATITTTTTTATETTTATPLTPAEQAIHDACHTEAKAEKDGKAPTEQQEADAFTFCVSAKKAAAEQAPAVETQETAPKTEETK